MRYVKPGESHRIELADGAPLGLVGVLAWRLENVDNEIVVADTTAGVSEYADGAYDALVPFAIDAGDYRLIAVFPDVELLADVVRVSELPDPGAPLGVVPTVADIGALLRARTKGSDQTGGDELGTFTADTRPTGAQVAALIAQAVSDVAMRVGADVDEDLHGSYRECVALRAAMLVEIGYYPEQTGDGPQDRTVYHSMRRSYEDSVETLVKAVQIRVAFRSASA